MINLATIGSSAITENFLAACRLTGRYKFNTAYSRTNERAKYFSEKMGFSAYTSSLADLAADKSIDAVYIASPNFFHYTQSRLLLENGKNVICEKPIVTDSKQFEELSLIAHKNNLIYTEAIMSRHSAGHKILHTALNQIGNISLARINFCQRSSRLDAYLSGKHTNIFDMSLAAGTLMDIGIYCVWAAIDMFGIPDSITAYSTFLNNGADSAGTAVFKYKDFPCCLTYSKTGQSYAESEIIGNLGTVKISSVSQYNGISLIQDGKETILYFQPNRAEIMSGEAINFADLIENTSNNNSLSSINNDTLNVHKCMDIIKCQAGIKYPIKE